MGKLISIIIPTYNMASYLAEAVNSVLSQDVGPMEVIVIDDHSTDNTTEVAASFGDRITYMKAPRHTGMVSTVRNTGMEIAQGEFIGFLDADDIMKPGKLKEQIEFLRKHPDVPLVCTNMRNFTKDGEASQDFLSDHGDFLKMPKTTLGNGWYRLSSEATIETFMDDNFIGTPGVVVIRQSVIKEVGLFDEGLVGSEDLDLWIRIARTHDIGYIDRETILRRLHGTNLTSKDIYFHMQIKNANKHLATPLTPKARQRLMGYKARVLFDLGYRAQLKKERKEAVAHYWDSLRCRPRVSTFFALIKAAVL